MCSEHLEEVRRALEELAELEDLEIAQHARAAVATTAWRVNVEPASAAVSLGDGGQKSLPSMSLAVLSVPFLCEAARSRQSRFVKGYARSRQQGAQVRSLILKDTQRTTSRPDLRVGRRYKYEANSESGGGGLPRGHADRKRVQMNGSRLCRYSAERAVCEVYARRVARDPVLYSLTRVTDYSPRKSDESGGDGSAPPVM